MHFFLSSLRAHHLITISALVLASAASSISLAQFEPPPRGTQVHDPAALKPPAGARVAIIEFEDMECPDCARANPLLLEASTKYHIPWVRHDFPLPMHPWSFQAAVNARWFDTKSKALGDEYRNSVFANQPSITSTDVLVEFTQKFAQAHSIALPFAVDPQGSLAGLVKADNALGQRVGIEHTPTIWVATANSKGAPFVEVVDRSRLFQLIDQALADTASAPKPTAPKASAKAASAP
jgi:protein-disulfide isomerase